MTIILKTGVIHYNINKIIPESFDHLNLYDGDELINCVLLTDVYLIN